MIMRFLITLGGFAILVFALGATKAAQIAEMSKMDHSRPPAAVSTTQVQLVQWRPVLRAIGTVMPIQGIMVSADADGTVVRIPVENGAYVQEGDLLVELDTSIEAAQLNAAKARAEWSRVSLVRARELRERQTISQAEVDAAVASEKQAVAEVAATEALIAKKLVRAPFSGRVGIRDVNIGQFIGRGKPLIPLQKLDTVFVNFSVPQRQLPLLALQQTVSVAVDAFPSGFAGKITAINAEVDASTRNVAIQATLLNPEEKLRSGMFARIEVELPETAESLVVPATSIAYASYGNSIFIVTKMKDEKGAEYLGVRQEFVTLGEKRGDLIAISGNIKAGEQVVTAGVFKLRNGLPVQVNDTVQPTSSPNPKPSNT